MTIEQAGPADPIAQAVQDIHAVGESMGFRRLRIDRSGYGGDDQRPDAFFEVGYGCKEIKVRTYRGDGQAVGIYRANANKVDLEQVTDLLVALLDEVDTHEGETARAASV